MMKQLRNKSLKSVGVSVLGVLVLSGCAQQQNADYTPATARTQTALEPVQSVPMTTGAGFGPSHTTVDYGGVPHIKGSMSFPTGFRGHDGLLLEKTVPAEVMVGQTFNYHYDVINLTPYPIHQVVLKDRVTGNFTADSSAPEASSVSNGLAVWEIGELGPREAERITVTGKAAEEGTITTCGWATYSPIQCEPIRVVQADLELIKTGPSVVVICDPIPYTITVRNTGSSVLTNVRVTDTMDSGLRASTGGSSATFDVGTLRPGENRQLSVIATATSTGEFTNVAKAMSSQGVEAEDSVTTVVTAPALSITCSTPKERFIGQQIEICATVTNSGSAASEGTVVEVAVPAGASFRGANVSGQLVGNKVVWNLGSLAAKGSKEVCANFVGMELGTLVFNAVANGDCADPASSTCTAEVSGVPAVLLEVIDIKDPIEVGTNETYEITVTNQGSAQDTNIVITCTLEDSQEYVNSSGATSGSANGQKVIFAPLASLAPGAKAKWSVVIKAVKVGDVRFSVQMDTDEIERSVNETESTNQY
ncbi:MAG: Large cysteine-rich periplasmic protein OmcB [Verrucomicrobia subdivision 3 bacterium]|nr:Large cysteine-rich periplasmic protein OmcB [Limisphaerales bacterium]MCS1414214.1 Large cysteine-rich periplasmic protein OmcB [Limisphaerales bacterium]